MKKGFSPSKDHSTDLEKYLKPPVLLFPVQVQYNTSKIFFLPVPIQVQKLYRGTSTGGTCIAGTHALLQNEVKNADASKTADEQSTDAAA